VSAEEWISYIESDPELVRAANQNEKSIEAKLAASSDDDGQVLRLSSGSISSSYPQPSLLTKMFQIAKHFGAYVVSDDGDIYTLSETGKLQISEQ
jgi:hypothetical protein